VVKRYVNAEDRRVQVFEAAVAYLGQPDNHTLSMNALGDFMGYDSGNMRKKFGTPDDLLRGLMTYVEESLASITGQIVARKLPGRAQAARVLAGLLQFAEKNPGLCRILAGDAVCAASPGLRARVATVLDSLGALTGGALMDLAVGRMRRFVTSGFTRLPTAGLDAVLNELEPLW
jgi:TetR/AcrR family transcriptional regulator